MHISVRMTTISIWMVFRHAHFCTNDYHFFWMDCRHARFCANDYHFFLNGFSSCTFLYEWLTTRFIWGFVMYILCNDFPYSLYKGFRHAFSVQMTLHILVYGFSSCIFCAMTFHILLVFHDVCNALQRVNSMEHWRIIKDIIMYIGFWPCVYCSLTLE